MPSPTVIICATYRNRFTMAAKPRAATPAADWPAFNLWQTTKGLVAAAVLLALFFTSIPRELSTITVAGFLLCSRKMRSRQMMELVDWHLITLFCALFIVVQGIVAENIPGFIIEAIGSRGYNLTCLTNLAAVSTVMSNLVSNVPAVMLLIRFLDPAQPLQWYVLALSSTFAGNLIVIGSIANLIVIEQARKLGVDITFREYALTGVPVTLFSLLVLALYAMIFTGH